MRFVYNDGIISALSGVYFLIDDRELLKCRYNDTCAFIEGFQKVFAGFAFSDCHYRTQRMVKAGNSLLQLLIQYGSIGHDNNT